MGSVLRYELIVQHHAKLPAGIRQEASIRTHSWQLKLPHLLPLRSPSAGRLGFPSAPLGGRMVPALELPASVAEDLRHFPVQPQSVSVCCRATCREHDTVKTWLTLPQACCQARGLVL